MRLWHKSLIPVLPRQQLCGQWRECCMIAKLIHENGTPNHLLVNAIMNYPINEFIEYCGLVADEMEHRQYRVNRGLIYQYFDTNEFETVPLKNLFLDWHDDRYLKQCYYNLQEKYDCDGISADEWQIIFMFMRGRLENES